MKIPPAVAVALAAFLVVCASKAQSTSPYIAEFMADNQGTLVDEDEDTPDWIEIHHRGEEPVNLENYGLTDDLEEPGKWNFPNVVLEPDARLLVYASGKDRRLPLGNLHTNFSLNAEGEYLALFDADGRALSVWEAYPAQAEDESFGLSADRRSVTLIDTKSSCRWLVPVGDRQDLSWTAPNFNDDFWFVGTNGIGYDFGLDYHEWILTDVSVDMAGFASSVQTRFSFEVEEVESLIELDLFLRFDDGFVAFLNGERVAEDSAPEELRTSSVATVDRHPSDAIEEVRFDLEGRLDLVVEGTNVLAIQGLDASVRTGDFLVHPRLEVIYPIAEPGYGIMREPTPGAQNLESYAGRVSEVVFEQRTRFIDGPLALTMATETPGAQIYYTYDGTPPTPDDFPYEGVVEVDETLAVRARAFGEGLLPSRVTTRTYVLVEELAAQSVLNQTIVGRQRELVEQGLREALPIVSLAVDPTVMFGDGGLEAVPEQTREVPVSVEFFSAADAGEEFQVDAGLAIHGGNARAHPKKPFRLFFRREYGAGRLRFPLFEGSPVASFDQLILRAGGHDGWSISPGFGSTFWDLPFHASYMRDQFLRKTELEMGLLSPRGRYVQLIINGFYWGVYDLHERPNATYFRDHLGGKKSDWDVVHHSDTLEEEWAVIDGSDATWKMLHESLKEGIGGSRKYGELQEWLDLDGLIDAHVLRMWSGDFDWAGPVYWGEHEVTLFRNKNWYAARRGGMEPGFFRFFSWDAEISMGLHLMSEVFAQPVNQQILDLDLTAVDDPGTPAAIHGAMRFLPDYRRRFGDRVQRHLFGDGALNVPASQARWDGLRDALDPTMVAESARWGDLHSVAPPFTRDANWRPQVEWVRNRFIPERREILIEQLRKRGLFPVVAAPRMTPFGGSLDAVGSVRLEADEGSIYFTLDGYDPATSVGFVRRVLLDESSPGHFLVPSIVNGGSVLKESWKNVEVPPFFENWAQATASVGYDTALGSFFEPYYETEVIEMNGVNTSIYLRVPFEVASPENVETLVLRVKYDDGFAVFLNGEPLVAVAEPDPLTWFSEAVSRRPDEDAVFYQDFDVISQGRHLLRAGSNLLAIQGLNGGIASSDFLFAPQLIAIETTGVQVPSAGARVYAEPLRMTEETTLKARVRAESGEWSALTEAFFFPGQLPGLAKLRISEVHYHPLASGGQPSSAFEFIEIVNVDSQPVQLAGVRFSEGIEFEFGAHLLGEGERVVVVNNREAFSSRYGQELAGWIVGEYGANWSLSNGGETLALVDGRGMVLDRLTYDDEETWPEAADGGGMSLVRHDLQGDSSPANWRASAATGGSPGMADPELTYAAWRAEHFRADARAGEPLADPDEDGQENLMEYFSGSDPGRADLGAGLAIGWNPEGTLTLIYQRRSGVGGARAVIEGSSDLLQWDLQSGGVEILPLGGGVTTEVRHTVAASANRWYRLKISLEN